MFFPKFIKMKITRLSFAVIALIGLLSVIVESQSFEIYVRLPEKSTETPILKKKNINNSIYFYYFWTAEFQKRGDMIVDISLQDRRASVNLFHEGNYIII